MPTPRKVIDPASTPLPDSLPALRDALKTAVAAGGHLPVSIAALLLSVLDEQRNIMSALQARGEAMGSSIDQHYRTCERVSEVEAAHREIAASVERIGAIAAEAKG